MSHSITCDCLCFSPTSLIASAHHRNLTVAHVRYSALLLPSIRKRKETCNLSVDKLAKTGAQDERKMAAGGRRAAGKGLRRKTRKLAKQGTERGG